MDTTPCHLYGKADVIQWPVHAISCHSLPPKTKQSSKCGQKLRKALQALMVTFMVVGSASHLFSLG